MAVCGMAVEARHCTGTGRLKIACDKLSAVVSDLLVHATDTFSYFLVMKLKLKLPFRKIQESWQSLVQASLICLILS